MEKVSVPLIEQETDIIIDPTTKRATVYSCIPTTIKQLYKLAKQHDEVRIELDNKYGLMISVPQKWIKVRPPVKRILTDEQKAAAAERAKALYETKKEKQE